MAAMRWSTDAQDCLYVNWAIPRDTAPDLPSPLSYEVHRSDGQDFVFVSALLFRLSGLRPDALPWLRISYPQMNLRLYVLDGEGRPAMLFKRMWVPFWVAPVSRFLGRQPSKTARLRYPLVSQRLQDGEWSWSVHRGHRLELAGRLASPRHGPGPDLGSWQQTLLHFRNRPRGYVRWGRGLRSIRASHPSDEVMPLQVDITDSGLLSSALPGCGTEVWDRPHSAWLCPRIPFAFEVGKPLRSPLAGRRVVAAEGSSCRQWKTDL